jgi:hypothetical protein
MAQVTPFFSSHTAPGEPHVYHDESECGRGKQVIRYGYQVEGTGTKRKKCASCATLTSVSARLDKN